MFEMNLLIHMVSGTLAILGGAFFVFNKEIFVEKFYLAASIFASISGFFLISGIEEGFIAKLGFFTLFLFWFFSVLMFATDSSGSNKWFIRSFALALTFISVRIWDPIFYNVLNVDQVLSYTGAIWFSWVTNLIIAEWFIIKQD